MATIDTVARKRSRVAAADATATVTADVAVAMSGTRASVAMRVKSPRDAIRPAHLRRLQPLAARRLRPPSVIDAVTITDAIQIAVIRIGVNTTVTGVRDPVIDTNRHEVITIRIEETAVDRKSG